MNQINKKLLIIFDDREITNNDIGNIVGCRHYGEIIFKRHSLFEYFKNSLSILNRFDLIRIFKNEDVQKIKINLNNFETSKSVFIISNRAGFSSLKDLEKLFERLPYAEEDFVDRISNPLIFYFHNLDELINLWTKFEKLPLHKLDNIWQGKQILKSIPISDLSNLGEFLNFISGSTATRHFNNLEMNDFFIIKNSKDITKIKSEYLFYKLVPEAMKPWLVPTFDYVEKDNEASYKMLRYFLADASLQWVHGAFSIESFQYFINRILFFINSRSKKSCSKKDSIEIADNLFIKKVQDRIKKFLSFKEGIAVNELAQKINPKLDLNILQARYLEIFNKEKNKFTFEHSVIGHGDPCLSNILYDSQRNLLIFIDPKGAQNENQLWTHPLYDLCKISHSIIGDYDFINNGLYEIKFLDNNNVKLIFKKNNQDILKKYFIDKLNNSNYDFKTIRLGEISLFLSMLPLHIDVPNKALAFIINSSLILDELENGK